MQHRGRKNKIEHGGEMLGGGWWALGLVIRGEPHMSPAQSDFLFVSSLQMPVPCLPRSLVSHCLSEPHAAFPPVSGDAAVQRGWRK
mmetsp:Transcript_16374/g.41534  ORF Transcript_16374/g.41534 Transcript_16374/m.41534 type:complete len:86 (-) Transcript_16374:708-965(-)